MTFEPRHDAGQLGKLVALDDGGQPIPLASLADLVRHAMGGHSPTGLPLDAAVKLAFDRLQAPDRLPGLYRTAPSSYAEPVAPDFVVRVARPAKENRVATTRPIRSSSVPPLSTAANAGSSPGSIQIQRSASRPELRGPSGCLAWLREVWTSNPRGEAALVDRRCAVFAIRLDVAEALFGFGKAEAQLAPVLHLVPEKDAVADAVLAASSGPAAPVVFPSNSDRLGCEGIYRYWVSLGGEKLRATALIAKKYGVTARLVQMRIKPFRDVIEPGPAANRANKSKRASASKAKPVKNLASVWTNSASKASGK